MANFDLIIHKVGGFGWYQILHWILFGSAFMPTGNQNLMNVFLQATPEHWCHVSQLSSLSATEQRSLAEAHEQSQHAKADSSCQILDLNYTSVYVNYRNNLTQSKNDTNVIDCTEWRYNYDVYGITAVTQWDLVCSKGTYPAIAQFLYMLGFLLGAILFGYLSDRYGRKPSLCLSFTMVTVFGIISAFIPNYWGHVFVRVLVAMGAVGNITIAFVCITEIMDTKKRIPLGISSQMFFALGYMILTGIALLIQDFKWTNFTISVSSVVCLLFWWKLPESPRWLLANNRAPEAQIEIQRMATMNKVSVDVEEIIQEYIHLDKQEEIKRQNYTMIDLVRTPNMRKKTLIVIFTWFVISMVYYGLFMGAAEINVNPHLNLFISGITECLGCLSMLLTVDRFGRRLCLSVVSVLGGLSCAICGLLPSVYYSSRIALAFLGKFSLCAAFALIYVFTAELFPTVVRTIGLGTGSMGARIGGLLAPFIGELNKIWTPLPTLVFGACAILSGLMGLWLPETLGQTLPDTLEEGERFGRSTKFFQFLKFKAEKKEKQTHMDNL